MAKTYLTCNYIAFELGANWKNCSICEPKQFEKSGSFSTAWMFPEAPTKGDIPGNDHSVIVGNLKNQRRFIFDFASAQSL
jgi:hypothetical protein